MSQGLQILILVLHLLFFNAALAATEEDQGTFKRLRPIDTCQEILVSRTKLVFSGREGANEKADIEAAAKEILGDGGLFDRLGISRPYQTVRFLPGGDLNIFGSLNTIPVAHWIDGSKIAKTDTRGLLYELVIPGKTEQNSYYRDDGTLAETVSLFFHALAGHVHVAQYSNLNRAERDANPVDEAYSLSYYMDTIRQRVNTDEVSNWYQYLMSLDYAQDLFGATSELPKSLKVQPAVLDPKTGQMVERFRPTSNILQAFVANLPPQMPEWKKEMARRVERLRRYIPGAIKTKILHEGYSTLMQEILPQLTSFNTGELGIHYCCMLGGIAAPSIRNPYWIGTEAWRNIYKRFLNRPEIAALPDMEAKIKAFIAYAKTEIIAVMDDAMLLRHGLDEDWVARNNFALTRAYKDDEYNPWDGNLTPPDPNDPKKNWPYSIITRDGKKVIEALVGQLTGSLRFQIPNVVLTAMNERGSGQVAMEVSDLVGREVALDRTSIVETLYVMSRIQERPVGLESTFDIAVQQPQPTFDDEDDGWGGSIGWGGGWWWRPPPPVFNKTRIKVVVSPSGEVQAYKVLRGGSAEPSSLPGRREFATAVHLNVELVRDPKLSEELTEILRHFIVNLNIEKIVDQDRLSGKNVFKTFNAAVDAAVESSSTFSMAVPTSSRSLIEYANFLGRRLGAALKNAILGKGKIIRLTSGVKIAALPRIPYFNFDDKSMQRFRDSQKSPPLPVVSLTDKMMTYSASTILRPEDLTDIHPVPGNAGDIIWGPKPKGGDGDGDGDQPGGKDASDNGGNEEFEQVDLPTYAEALAEEGIELPNLRPKMGPVQKTTDELKGNRRQQTGHAVSREIMRNAFRRGLPSIQEREANPDEPIDGLSTVRKGLRKLRVERDWVVKNIETKPDPDINALVVFKMDMSGSMGYFKKHAKAALYDLRAMLMQKYKNVKFLFIAFNAEAHVFDDPEKFFRFQPNGGTVYSRAWEKTVELYQNYPEASWDRYSVTVGDMYEAFGPRERNAFEAMKEQTSFTTVLAVNDSQNGSSGGLEDFLRSMAQEDEFVGFVKIAPPDSYFPLIWREAFKNPPK